MNVVEFRHESWWNPIVLETLFANNIAFSGVDYPKLPNQVIDSKLTYYRFHGSPHLFYSAYSVDELQKVMEAAIKLSENKAAFIYFNNTASTAGIQNALAMQELLLTTKL